MYLERPSVRGIGKPIGPTPSRSTEQYSTYSYQCTRVIMTTGYCLQLLYKIKCETSARGGCRLLKLLIYYVSSKASKATTTTDCLEVTRNKRTVHRNSPECSARSDCCYCFVHKGMISTSLKSFHSTDYKTESLQSHGWTCLV